MFDPYSEILLDHYRLPRNKGRLEHPTVTVEGVNPLCGDELTFDLEIEGDRLTRVTFDGKGCAISLASASMLTEILQGKTLSEVEKWIGNFRSFIREGAAPNGVDLGELAALEGISKLPVRVKCATLPWTTIEEALRKHRQS
ncbi:SUF system NifU family Fe-S cluster assembly protein [bacterium]|nr:SUF system NifU family Fe-S cluster assembly protein [bacterium]MBU1983411.1 SUF system NifU family Fe-S cluster assembly protein [bacterium]